MEQVLIMCHPRYALWIVLICAFSFGLVKLASIWIPGMARLSNASLINILDYLPKTSLSIAIWIVLPTIPVIWAVRHRRQ